MHFIPSHIRGPCFMVVATGSYLANDTCMKLVTDGLPPYQVLFMRGVAALMWGVPLLILFDYQKQVSAIVAPRVLQRNVLEMIAILAYVIALANMPIADATALGQITPLIVLLGARIVFGERISGLQSVLIALGFVGALFVAQPSLNGISYYALLALANAVVSAGRDIASRRIQANIPGLVVAVSAALIVMMGALIAHLSLEEWTEPTFRHFALLLASGLFLMGGHFCLITAYRTAPSRVVAPFYYSFTVWAVVSGVLVFGEFPDLSAIFGIVLVMASGLAIVLLDKKHRGPAIVS